MSAVWPGETQDLYPCAILNYSESWSAQSSVSLHNGRRGGSIAEIARGVSSLIRRVTTTIWCRRCILHVMANGIVATPMTFIRQFGRADGLILCPA